MKPVGARILSTVLQLLPLEPLERGAVIQGPYHQESRKRGTQKLCMVALLLVERMVDEQCVCDQLYMWPKGQWQLLYQRCFFT